MKTSSSLSDLLAAQQHWTSPVALVPTMGALHRGHLSLFRKAREAVGAEGTVVASIFVNPLQFDRPEDLQSYPRTIDDDLSLCQQEGVDHVFLPSATDFYSENHSIMVLEKSLTSHLCGSTRPGHFDGVCTVVLKLFNAVNPHVAIFGKKDYQQLAIIKRMVRDLNFPVQVIGAETFREEDGLAMSSRNINLTTEDRGDAPRIRKALLAAQSLAITGEQDPAKYLNSARQQLEGAPEEFKIDYLELVSQDTLQPISNVNEPALLAIAAFYKSVRLIDNIEINPA